VTILDDHRGGEPPEDGIVLQVCGVGSHALLAGEAGLHQLTRGRREGRDGKRRPVERDVVRVEVLPMVAGPEFAPAELRVEVRQLTAIRGRLIAQPRHDVRVLHLPSLISVRAWTDGSKAEAVERLHPLLRARVEASRAAADTAGRPPMVRRYSLGPTTLVRDARSGRSTGRLDQVLAGQLDVFLTPPGAGDRARSEPEA
jgi:protein subunit release factor A